MSNSPRWRTALTNRKYQCHSCLCLMGLHTRCLNTNCECYTGSLSPDKPHVYTYGGIKPRPLAT
jgi:hypothetical protein